MENKIFDSNPNLKEYYQTSDGIAFYKENDAKNYARTLKSKEVKKVVRDLEESKPTDEALKLDYREAIKAIQTAETLEQLEQFKDYPQPSVLKALEDKTAELTALINVTAEDVTGTDETKTQE